MTLWFLILGPKQKHVPQCNECMAKRSSKCKLNMSTFFFNISHQPTKVGCPFSPKLPLSDQFLLFVVKQDIFLEMSRKQDTTMGKNKFFIFIFSLFDCWNSKDNDWAELYGRQLCTASLSKKSHLQFWITQMSFSFHRYLNLKIYSILFILQESYTNDPFLNTCMVFLHLDTKYLIIYV